jgi:hypothetical protein
MRNKQRFDVFKNTLPVLLTLFFAQSVFAEVACPKDTILMSTIEDQYTINWCINASEDEDSAPSGENFIDATMNKVFKNLNGPLEMINSESKVVLSTNYKNGLLDGSFKKYYSDGSKMSVGHYKEGLATGVWSRYYENGQLRDNGKMANGQPVGIWTFYDNRGKIISTKDFEKKIADAKSRIRFGAFEVSMEEPSCYNCPGGDYTYRNTKTEIFLGYDRKIMDLGKSLRLRWVSDLSSFNFPSGNSDYYDGYDRERVLVLLSTANFEWVPAWYSKISLSLRLGGVLLSKKNSSGDNTDSAYGLELRYYFDKPYLFGVDSFFINPGIVGGGDSSNKSQPGGNETDTTLFGFQFVI